MRGGARAIIAIVAVGAGALICLFSPSPWPQLVGLPLGLAGLFWGVVPLPSTLASTVRRLEARPITSWGLPVLALAVLVCVVYAPLLQGWMPWAAGQADHPTHQYQAWLLVEHMLPTGRISGWSDLRWAGYPALELYPIGGPLWVALVRALTLGQLDWEATYALAILAMVLLNVSAVYIVTRRLAGPWAALAAAVLVLFERGWPRQGGDHYAIDVGVWPVTMGFGPFLLAVERQWAWISRRTDARGLAAAAFFAGWALLCHPMYLPVLILAAPCVFGVALAGRAANIPPDRAVAGVVLTLALGFMLAAFWYLPFITGSAFSEPGGAPFRSIANLGEGLAMASVAPNFWTPALILGVIGGLLALSRGGGIAVLALLVLALFFAAAATPLELSGALTRLSASVQQERFFIPGRVLLCLLAGFALSFMAQLTHRWMQRDLVASESWSLRRRLTLVVLVALATPFTSAAVEGVIKHVVVPITELEHGPSLEHRRDLLALCDWLQEQSGDQQQVMAPRTAWYVGYGRHEYNNAPVHCGMAQIIDTPAETYDLRPGGISQREVRAFNVRWVVGDRPIEGRDHYLRLERRFGRLHLYEVRDYEPQRVTMLGTGRATVEQFSDELIRIRIEGAGEGSRLALHVSRYRNWEARMNGEPVGISSGHLGLPRAELMHVDVDDGLLELRYRREPIYWIGALLSLIGGLLLGFVGLLGAAPRLGERLLERRPFELVQKLPAWSRALVYGLVGVGLLLPLVVGGDGEARRDEARVEGARPGEATLADLLNDAQVWLLERGGEGDTPSEPRRRNLVRRWDGRFGSNFPPEVLVDRHVEALDLGDPRRVVAGRVSGSDELHIRWPQGRFRGLRGAFARGGRGRGETSIEIWLGHERLDRFSEERLGTWQAFEATASSPDSPLEIVIRAPGRPGRAVLIDAAVLR